MLISSIIHEEAAGPHKVIFTAAKPAFRTLAEIISAMSSTAQSGYPCMFWRHVFHVFHLLCDC